jgi:LPXTG-site transpeptidase (sortase) family protein
MPRRAPRAARAVPRRGRIAGLLTALVLAVNAAVLAGGWVTNDDGRSLPSPVELAAGPEAASTDDPVSGFDFDVPLPLEVDGLAELPVPEPAPANPYAATPDIRHGVLEIPAIGLSQPLFEGVSLTAINRGPSHWPGTAMPGELGNVVVAGHRTTYTKPFWALDELQPGDELVFTIGAERTVYELDRLEIVAPEDVHIVDQHRDFQATLFACHPRGSARQRIVGHFRMKPDTVSVEMSDRWWALSPFRAL